MGLGWADGWGVGGCAWGVGRRAWATGDGDGVGVGLGLRLAHLLDSGQALLVEHGLKLALVPKALRLKALEDLVAHLRT